MRSAEERLIVQALREAASYTRIGVRKREYLELVARIEVGEVVVEKKGEDHA